MVAVVLFLFLGHFRTAFISLTAIPLSLLAAIILLDKFGVTLNTITLGGLAISIGAVVDDAIIDVENIFRRLRVNQEQGRPHSNFKVTLDACTEVYSAVVYATFIVALIFLPVLTLTGLEGSFFAPLALSYILAIMASLAVALTVTPALALLFFSKGVKHTEDPLVQRWLKAAYRKVLGVVARWPRALLAIGVALCVGSFSSICQPDRRIPAGFPRRAILSSKSRPFPALRCRKCCASAASSPNCCWPKRRSPQSNSKWAAPNRARIPGSRTAANFTSN